MCPVSKQKHAAPSAVTLLVLATVLQWEVRLWFQLQRWNSCLKHSTK